MWQRFTQDARKVVFFAQEEAGRLGQTFVSSEHLLLGITREPGSAAALVLDKLGFALKPIRDEVLALADKSESATHDDMRLTVHAKRVVDMAHDEARQLDNDFIGTEHLLLGIVREDEGLGGRVLKSLGVTLDAARREVERLPADRPDASTAGLRDSADEHLATVRMRGNGHLKQASKLDAPLRTEVAAATRLAGLLGQPHVTPVHLAVVLLSDPPVPVIRLLGQFDIDPQALLVQFPEADATTPANRPTHPTLSYEAGYVLTRAVEKAGGLFHETVVGREHLLLALIEEAHTVGPILRAAGLEPYAALQELLRQRESE